MQAGTILRTILTWSTCHVCFCVSGQAQTTTPTSTASKSTASKSTAPETRPSATTTTPTLRSLNFAWPRQGTVRIVSEHLRETREGDSNQPSEKRSFHLEFDLELAAESAESELQIGRRNVRLTLWNGEPVPDSQRSLLAPIELQTELLPDLRVRSDGRVREFESIASFTRRVQSTIEQREAGALGAEQANDLRAGFRDVDIEPLKIRAQKAWDEWIGRWKDLDFRERDSAEFQGEIELPTGDVVDGTFKARHLGATQDRDEHVRLRLEFEASGSRLDLAAMRWRQRLLDVGDEPFRVVSLEFRERSDCVLRPETMQPATVTTTRETTIRDGDESQTIVETTHWEFVW